MPLFGFGDITFNKNGQSVTGPLAALSRSPFQTNTMKFPLDVGNADKGHYMMIYIRKQKSSTLQDSPNQDSISQATQSVDVAQSIKGVLGGNLGSSVSNVIDKINTATGGIVNNIAYGVKNVTSIFGTNTPTILSGNGPATQSIINRNLKNLQMNGGKLSTTQLTSDAIALYMPDTMQFNFNQNYEDLSLTSNLVGLVGIAAAEQLVSGYDQKKAIDAAKAVASRVGAGLGDIGKAGAFLAFGSVINPMLEVIYKSPSFRSFDYVFKFYPRSEREAIEVQKIINLLQYHQAPEIKTDGSISMLIPPSEFDIKFYYAGNENKNIPQIGTCVLKSIQVNYAPNGWSAYEVPNQSATVGGTGMPVGIEMTLSFQEVTYLTKGSNLSQQTNEMSAAWNATGAVNEKGEGIY